MQSPTFELNHKVVRAGAGAGKTTQLTSHVLEVAKSFYKEYERWPQIVVTTFTRKATQELRERLILKACESGDAEILEYVTSTSRLQISTIHGVLSSFLRQYTHLVGMDSQFKIISDREAKHTAKKILREVLLKNSHLNILLETFSFTQLSEMVRSYSEAKIMYPESKPHNKNSLEQIYQRRLSKIGVEVQEVLESLGTEVAGNEKWTAYIGAITRGWSELNKGTALSGEGIYKIFKSGGSKPRQSKTKPEVSEELDSAVKELFKKLKDELSHPAYQKENWETYLGRLSQFQELGEAFNKSLQAHKSEVGVYEMGDLELQTLNIVREYPELARSFSMQWDYWLVDEYQDTSPIQVQILGLLKGEKPQYVVGDPQQSIYLFRGARSEVFFEKERELNEKGLDPQFLMKNYRSQPELLLFFNALFTKMSSQFQEMEPRSQENLNSQKVVAHFALAERGSGNDKAENEKLALVEHVTRLYNEGIKFEDICVLSRTNKSLGEISQLLNQYNIPTHVHASSGFYDRREIIDALALLKFLVNPFDNYNLILLLRSPWCKVSDEALKELMTSKPSFLWDMLIKNKELLTESLEHLETYYKLAQEKGVSYSFKKALVDLGFIDLSHKHDSTGRRESNLWKLLQRLSEEEKKPGFNFLDFISSRFTDLSDLEGGEESEAVAALEPNRLNLMTIHASKGLQFKHVIVHGLDKKPSVSRQQSSKPLFNIDETTKMWSLLSPVGEDAKMTSALADLEVYDQLELRERDEHERLLYVALTRAKESVFLSWVMPTARNSWAEKVRLDLTEGLHENENFSYKVDFGPWSPQRLSDSKNIVVQPREPYGHKGSSQEEQKLEKISVSELLEEKFDLKEMEHVPVSGEKLQKQVRSSSEGILFHRLMERLKYESLAEVESSLEVEFGIQSEKVKKALQYVLNLKEVPMKELLSQGEVEWGFQLLSEKGILEGQIDLWGVVKRVGKPLTYVIDYKSGSMTNKEKAFEQLRLYSQALKEYGAPDPILRVVIYPFLEAFESRSL